MKIKKEQLSLMSIAQKRTLLIKLAKQLKNAPLIIKEIKKMTDYEIERTIERVFEIYVWNCNVIINSISNVITVNISYMGTIWFNR